MASPPAPSRSPKPGVRFTEGATEIPPPKPPRPVNKHEEDAKALAEMFPETDAKVIKAVLFASGGDVMRATNALLSMDSRKIGDIWVADNCRHVRSRLQT
jgi:hypothetical protein